LPGPLLIGRAGITPGASGFVAAHVLSALLEAGYNVKCAVTSAAEADNIRKHRPLQTAHLAFAVATDAAVPGAFDDAVAGVKGVCFSAVTSESISDRFWDRC